MSQFDKYKQKPPAVFTCMVGVSRRSLTILAEFAINSISKFSIIMIPHKIIHGSPLRLTCCRFAVFLLRES